MRIKRFIAPDMRTALRQVRDEHGPDAVILSNRPVAGGIEVVAATDYDEALVHQALRAAAPGIQPIAAPAAEPLAAVAPSWTDSDVPNVVRAGSRQASRADDMIAAMAAAPAPVRESLIARARGALSGKDHSPSRSATAVAEAPSSSGLVPSEDFRALLARLTESEGSEPTLSLINTALAAPVGPAAPANDHAVASRAAAIIQQDRQPVAAVEPPPLPAIEPAPGAVEPTFEALIETVAEAAPVEAAPSAPVLQLVTAPTEDPMLRAMRTELAGMRVLMEQQMGQLALERLRGHPARAAAFDILMGYGCDEALAQQVAARLDSRLTAAQIRVPMQAELMRLIQTTQVEPIELGGVIALVGPTGAGKTTTAAKLAARYAAKHGARDVALVTADGERAGAREQLQAHGRRLGITVCEAAGPEALNETLAQLADYPLVLIDTAGYAARDRALLGQILWLRSTPKVRSLLVLPANANPHDLTETIRRYRPASPEGVVLTKTDDTSRLGTALSVLIKQDLALAYTADGQRVPGDIDAADASGLVLALETLRRAADHTFATEDRHVS